MKRFFLTGSFSALCLLASALAAEDPLKGRLSYFKEVDFSGRSRIIEMDGESVVAHASLAYHSRPGVMDGDGGTDFHLRITAPDQMKTGASYVLNQSIFQARAAEWASPHYYRVFPNLRGSVVLVKYVKFREMVLDADIEYGDGKKFKGRIHFENHDMWRRFKGTVDWNSFDASSSRSRQQIRPEDLQGSWKGVEMIQENSGILYTLLDRSLEPGQFLAFEKTTLKRAASLLAEPYILKENTIVVSPAKNEQNRKVNGVINRITASELVVSWTESWTYEGKEFSSRNRIVYRRAPQRVP